MAFSAASYIPEIDALLATRKPATAVPDRLLPGFKPRKLPRKRRSSQERSRSKLNDYDIYECLPVAYSPPPPRHIPPPPLTLNTPPKAPRCMEPTLRLKSPTSKKPESLSLSSLPTLPPQPAPPVLPPSITRPIPPVPPLSIIPSHNIPRRPSRPSELPTPYTLDQLNEYARDKARVYTRAELLQTHEDIIEQLRRLRAFTTPRHHSFPTPLTFYNHIANLHLSPSVTSTNASDLSVVVTVV